jgi:hypothetical protein
MRETTGEQGKQRKYSVYEKSELRALLWLWNLLKTFPFTAMITMSNIVLCNCDNKPGVSFNIKSIVQFEFAWGILESSKY